MSNSYKWSTLFSNNNNISINYIVYTKKYDILLYKRIKIKLAVRPNYIKFQLFGYIRVFIYLY
jgi:hypothetical protein